MILLSLVILYVFTFWRTLYLYMSFFFFLLNVWFVLLVKGCYFTLLGFLFSKSYLGFHKVNMAVNTMSQHGCTEHLSSAADLTDSTGRDGKKGRKKWSSLMKSCTQVLAENSEQELQIEGLTRSFQKLIYQAKGLLLWKLSTGEGKSKWLVHHWAGTCCSWVIDPLCSGRAPLWNC